MYIFSTLENVEFSRVEEKHNESGMRNPGGLKTSRFHVMYIFSTLENVEGWTGPWDRRRLCGRSMRAAERRCVESGL